MNAWQDFPAVTPPENVPLWITINHLRGCRFAEYSKETGNCREHFYNADSDDLYWPGEVVAFIVLPGPKS